MPIAIRIGTSVRKSSQQTIQPASMRIPLPVSPLTIWPTPGSSREQIRLTVGFLRAAAGGWDAGWPGHCCWVGAGGPGGGAGSGYCGPCVTAGRVVEAADGLAQLRKGADGREVGVTT